MALYNKKEFSKLCGIETKNLSVYIMRKKVVVDENELIDTTNQLNAAFILKAQAKTVNKGQNIPEEPVVYEAKVIKNDSKQTQNEDESEDVLSIAALDRKKLELDVKKKEADLEAVLIKNAKTKGEVIPFELMKPLIAQNNQSLTTAFKNAADEILSAMAKKKNFSNTEVAELNGTLVQAINSAIQKATDQSIKTLDILINDYQLTTK